MGVTVVHFVNMTQQRNLKVNHNRLLIDTQHYQCKNALDLLQKVSDDTTRHGNGRFHVYY